jgi:lipoprotein NlpI
MNKKTSGLKLNKGLTVDPRDERIFSNIAIVLDSLGNHSGAIESFDKALAIDPNYVLALVDKGVALNHLGNY